MKPLTATTLVLALSATFALADADPGRFDMAVERATCAPDGTFTVTTTGARFDVAPSGAINCFQRIPRERLVATVTCEAMTLGRATPVISADRYTCRIGPRNGPHVEITADSVVRIAPIRGGNVEVSLAFEPEWFAVEGQNLFAADPTGGCGAYQVPTRQGWAPFEAHEGRGARFTLGEDEAVLVSIFPPRAYDWTQHATERIVHDFPPLLEPGVASRPLPTDDQLRKWREFGNVLVLHLEMWDRFCEPGKQPLDPARFQAVCDLAHELGWRVLIYSSPYFYRAPRWPARNQSTPEEYLEQLDRLLEYPVDGIYWDGTYEDVERAWRVARLARQRLADRRLYVHCTRRPFHDSLVICPFVDTWADYLLRGEGRSRDFVDADYIRYIVSGWNVSNAIGTLCWDACRLSADIIDECLGAGAQIPYWPGGQINRGRRYYLVGNEHELYEQQYRPAAQAVRGLEDFAPLEAANRKLRAQLRAERRTRMAAGLAAAHAFIAANRARIGPTDNLAAFRPCVASGMTSARGQPGPHGAGYLPAYATDGDPRTYWAADYAPQWLRVDLGGEHTIGRLRVVNWAGDERCYHYRVECSLDGESWRTVTEKLDDAPATWEGDEHLIAPTRARYVRIVMLLNSANIGLHVGELEVYAPSD